MPPPDDDRRAARADSSDLCASSAGMWVQIPPFDPETRFWETQELTLSAGSGGRDGSGDRGGRP